MSIVAGIQTDLNFESSRLLEQLLDELTDILLNCTDPSERQQRVDAIITRLGTLHANIIYVLKESKRVTNLLGF
ncbi:hypothetical protein BOX15_Mlig027508g2 [Macrostomum lignano]|uniref:Phosphoenolpyruvate carboxylase n=2 Tax=Macrostomum lignano TaxID=282301 RepID=A0A1I8HUR3_9PLAT|nr:hypothetical protein BOX15_Mlig027508g1 [Macrostomum lignano]PAA75412.1 hypothetical protein BOX15_Mlig024417g1 [Macrostomum lignano]PAA82808.1 hypothetical protein BOX15_Mlig027508g3 [Macrostomum lignano]PAA82811.1 hypothetical protein BOX15_Mlig027508g2 [Macrostomum lignano]